MDIFRLHGDNIVECERIMDLILMGLEPKSVYRGFISQACPYVEVEFLRAGKSKKWQFQMFPGFNKTISDRWDRNILDLLKQEGSFLDEAPDVVLTGVQNNSEEIILAIEFCGALQAGNQAWQRSGRAYSTGRTRYPYIYIVDFVKYELDNTNRKRKNLRFPNPAVPYSYISHSRHTGNVIVQAYFKAEEFQPNFDPRLNNFDKTIFSERDVAEFIILSLLRQDTTQIEEILIDKNLKMVDFLSEATSSRTNFTKGEWNKLHQSGDSIVDYSISLDRFNFRKIIAGKSMGGYVKQFRETVQKYSIGMASGSLPFGIIK